MAYHHSFEIYNVEIRFDAITDDDFARVVQFLVDWQLDGLHDYDANRRVLRIRYTTPEFVNYMIKKTGVEPREVRYTPLLQFQT